MAGLGAVFVPNKLAANIDKAQTIAAQQALRELGVHVDGIGDKSEIWYFKYFIPSNRQNLNFKKTSDHLPVCYFKPELLPFRFKEH